jgi:hypothetical protein
MASNGHVPVLLLVGPSGSGKTTLGDWIAADLGFVHLDVDQYPAQGLDVEQLRVHWDRLWKSREPDDFAGAVRARAARAGRRGTVVSFPCDVMMHMLHIRDAEASGMSTVVLYGSGAECAGAWSERERRAGRRADQPFWAANNMHPYMLYSYEDYAPYRVSTFEGSGRRSRAALVAEVEKRLLSPVLS